MKEKLDLSIGGIRVVDKIINKSTGKIETIDRGHNLIVNDVLILIMRLLKGELTGIQYWAVGSGLDSWDNNPVSPLVTETKLTKEIGRKAISSSDLVFVDPITFEDSPTPTTCLKISSTFYEEECNGTWREFGIFGGNATTVKDSGYMIDKKHHSVLEKTGEMVVERTIYITISFS